VCIVLQAGRHSSRKPNLKIRRAENGNSVVPVQAPGSLR